MRRLLFFMGMGLELNFFSKKHVIRDVLLNNYEINKALRETVKKWGNNRLHLKILYFST